MSKSKILACPFCGKPPTIKQAGRTNYWWVGCEIHLGPESSGCGVSHSDYQREEAIRKWNERAGGRQPEPSAEAGDKHIALQGLVSRLEQELSDTKALLRFQEMHKSAEMLKDKSRLDWLLKESHIRFDTMDGCLYATCRQTIDDQMRAAEPANASS